jgi:hypothetical protein
VSPSKGETITHIPWWALDTCERMGREEGGKEGGMKGAKAEFHAFPKRVRKPCSTVDRAMGSRRKKRSVVSRQPGHLYHGPCLRSQRSSDIEPYLPFSWRRKLRCREGQQFICHSGNSGQS